MPDIALGTVQFGLDYGISNKTGGISDTDMKAILSEAHKAGVSMLDTAAAYGNSEERLGQFAGPAFKIVTKIPRLPDDISNVEDWVDRQITQSLEKLKRQSVYAVMLHAPDDLSGPNGAALTAGLRRLKAQGLAQKIGVSLYDCSDLETFRQYVEIDIVQVPVNILDRRYSEDGHAARMAKAGIEVHGRSAFLQGLLLMSPQDRPDWTRDYAPLFKAWDEWINSSSLSRVQACLAYMFTLEHLSHVVVGVQNQEQLRQIIHARDTHLNDLPLWPETVPDTLINPALWPPRSPS